MTIAGIVLAGGRSSRYGKPKMFEKFKDKLFYEYSIEALEKNSLSPIIISTNDTLAPYFKGTDAVIIIEEKMQAYQGPLFALYHAMSKFQHIEWFFVLSCDIPFITPAFVKDMISYVEKNRYDAIIPIQGDKIQPLLGLYHRRSITHMQVLVKENRRSMQALLDNLDVLTVQFPENEKAFVNINYQTDWFKHL